LIFSQETRGASPIQHNQSGVNFQNVYGLIVGVSNYKEVSELKYAHKDAALISKVINQSFSATQRNITTLINEEATEFAILEGLSSISKNAKSGDLVIFYFAGHGDVAYVEGSKRGYFLTSLASKSREYEAGGAVRFDAINDSIINITSKGAQVYLITDACRSGNIIDAQGASLTLNALNTGYEKTTKFISCQANELSYEVDQLGHGVFTYYLVKALDKRFDSESETGVTIKQLNSTLMDSVEMATNRKQSPTVMGADRYAEVFNYCEVSPIFKEIQRDINLVERKGSSSSSDDNLNTKIENALLDGNIFGNSKSALFLYKNAVTYNSLSPSELSEIRTLLVSELTDRAQRTMNDFLSGNIRAHEKLDFESAEKALNMASEIIGSSHPFFKTLNHRGQFFKAMQLLNEGSSKSLEESKRILLYLEENEPKATYVQQGLGMLYIQMNNKKEADEVLKKAKERIKTWVKPINTAAELKIIAGELGEAMNDLDFAEDISQDPAEANLLRAKLYMANEQLMQAQKAGEKAIKLGWKDQVETTLLFGKIEELRGRINSAKNLYGEQLKTQSENESLYLRLGELAEQSFDTTTAISYYLKAQKISPKNIIVKNKLNAIRSNEVKGDVDIYNITEVLDFLDILYKKREYSRGLALIEEVLAINNWTPDLHYERGKFLYALGKDDGATRVLKEALSISPYSFKSIKALVIILIEQNKFNEANALISKYDKYFRASSRWLTFKYQSYYQMNSTKDLFPILEDAIKLDSLDLTPRREMILLHIEANRYEYALKEHKELMKLGGNTLDENQLFVNINNQVLKQYKIKKYEGLLGGISYLIENDPTTAEYKLMGAMIAYMEGSYKKSQGYLINLQRNMQMLSPSFQMEIYKIKGKVFLETKRYEEAEMAFKAYNRSGGKAEYLGLAMAQFEMGKKREWQANFAKDRSMEGFNKDAFDRYQRMMKKLK
jgi:Flp pilus assembly protein TadD